MPTLIENIPCVSGGEVGRPGSWDFPAPLPPYIPRTPLLDYEVILPGRNLPWPCPENHLSTPLITLSPGIPSTRPVRNEPFRLPRVHLGKIFGDEPSVSGEAGFTPGTICETLNWDTVTPGGHGAKSAALCRSPKSAHHRKCQSQLLPHLLPRAFSPAPTPSPPRKIQHISHPAMLDHRLFPQGVSGWLTCSVPLIPACSPLYIKTRAAALGFVYIFVNIFPNLLIVPCRPGCRDLGRSNPFSAYIITLLLSLLMI